MCLCLALIPIVDCAVNQLQNALQLSFGPLSALQTLRGGLTVVMTFMVFAYFYSIHASDRMAFGVAALFFYCLLIYVCKEVFVTGTLEFESVTHYIQMVYWLEVWGLAVVTFDTPQRRRLALFCILLAGMMACASIFYGYLTGTRSIYDNQDVVASAGLFDTGKAIAGILVISGMASAYLLRDRADSLGPVVACTMFAGAFLTYARAGQVALFAGLFALLGWASVICRAPIATRWARRLLIWSLLGAAIGYVVLGTANLTARWQDLADPDQAGSGRIVFWRIALDSFYDADVSEQVLGRGYVGMYRVMQGGYGLRIHTHNDFLDMLLVGGVLGVFAWLVFWYALVVRLRSLSVTAAGYGAGLAILVGLFAQSVLTGQMFDPSAMSIYLIAFVCVTGTTDRDDPAGSMTSATQWLRGIPI